LLVCAAEPANPDRPDHDPSGKLHRLKSVRSFDIQQFVLIQLLSMAKKNLWITMICAICSLASAATAGAENIRVAIADDQGSVTLRSSSGLLFAGTPSNGSERQIVFDPASMGSRPARVRSTGELTAVNGKGYRGWIEVRKKRNGRLLVINDLDIEDYLRGVINSEIPSDWEPEALKAQAVASRTYALYQKREAGRRPYHILSTVKSQVYNGNSGERSKGVRAVRETRGLVIVYQGEIIPAFYHSSCGGHTENAFELWGIDEPYLQGVDCECQNILRDGLWEKRISTTQVMQALHRQGCRVTGIRDMTIGKITAAGRVKDVAILHQGGTKRVPAETLRAAIGTTLIPSVFFELELMGNEAVFSGRGSGHGVGLCQWGAEEMAKNGHDFREILQHYYPGTGLKQRD
jgi:stage II sporulation protein D (peptidoglycan lytic transglycosylase)